MAFSGNFKKTVRVNVQCKLTDNQWELFTSFPGSIDAANSLNRVFENNVNAGGTRAAVQKAMSAEMHRLRAFGAGDTEPLRVLDYLLDMTFGDEDDD